jgi:hypothetical protein
MFALNSPVACCPLCNGSEVFTPHIFYLNLLYHQLQFVSDHKYTSQGPWCHVKLEVLCTVQSICYLVELHFRLTIELPWLNFQKWRCSSFYHLEFRFGEQRAASYHKVAGKCYVSSEKNMHLWSNLMLAHKWVARTRNQTLAVYGQIFVTAPSPGGW